MTSKTANWNSPFRRKAAPLLLCLLALSVPSRAANDCPWLNEATAGGLLGGDAVGAITKATAGQTAVCLFTSDVRGTRRTLRITVDIVADAHARVAAAAKSCGADATPLRAIGNEAFACPADDRKGVAGERAMGRVRNQFFTIAIATSLKADPVLTRDVLIARIHTAAEQVAGNLF
jgi:hypothetical protein